MEEGTTEAEITQDLTVVTEGIDQAAITEAMEDMTDLEVIVGTKDTIEVVVAIDTTETLLNLQGEIITEMATSPQEGTVMMEEEIKEDTHQEEDLIHVTDIGIGQAVMTKANQEIGVGLTTGKM